MPDSTDSLIGGSSATPSRAFAEDDYNRIIGALERHEAQFWMRRDSDLKQLGGS